MATQSKLTVIDQLRNAVLEARANSDRLFEIVREDSLYDRPIPERNRIIFYVGHLEAFDWNIFRTQLFSLESRTAALDQLFAFGIDPVDGGLPTDQPSDWPSLSEVRSYVQTIRNLIDDALDAGNFPRRNALRRHPARPAWQFPPAPCLRRLRQCPARCNQIQ